MSLPRSNELSDAQASQALETYLSLQSQQTRTNEFVDSIKDSQLFKPEFDWAPLLAAAPTSISLLASIFVASTIPLAASVTITPPADGFKYLQSWGSHTSLNACLIQCSDQGQKAFARADASFDAISLRSSRIKNAVNQVIMLLQDPESASRMLPMTIRQISEIAKDCENKAREMDVAFSTWLDMVSELHVHVVQKSTDVAEKQLTNQLQLAIAQTQQGTAEAMEGEAAENLDRLGRHLDMAAEQYKKAAEDYPSGWEAVAQQFVSDLGGAVTNAINLAVPALIQSYTGSGLVQGGINVFDGSHGTVNGGASDQPVDHSQVKPATNVSAVTTSGVTPFAGDPAYGLIKIVAGYIGNIHSLLVNKEKGDVDWDALLQNSPTSHANILQFFAGLLSKYRQDFKPSSDLPSQTLLSIFDQVTQVADQVQSVINEHKGINGKALPAANSDQVFAWQRDIGIAFQRATQLATDAQALTTSTSVPTVTETRPPSDNTSAARMSVLEGAATKMEQAARLTESLASTYLEAGKQHLETIKMIGEIQAEIAGLKIESLNLEDIKNLLVQCINNLIQLKTQISRLVAFFSAMSRLVEHVVTHEVGPFIETIQAGDDSNEASILDFTFTNLQQQFIFGFAANVRAYFDLFRDIASMYLDVSNRHIRPGLDLVNNLQAQYSSVQDPDEAARILHQRTEQVGEYTKRATEGITEIVSERQREITSRLEERARNAQEAIAKLGVRPTASTSAAIEASATAFTDTATSDLKKSNWLIKRPLGDKSSLLID